MNNLLKKIYHWAALDILFPWQYSRNAKHSIQKNKAVFIEANLQTLPKSLRHFHDELDRQGGYTLSFHCLGEATLGRVQYIINALRCLKDIATADMVFICEGSRLISCISPRPETFITQLWHGCGAFKRFGLSSAKLKFGGDYKDNAKYPYHKNLNLVTVSSSEVIWAYAEAMDIKTEDNIIQATGISRTDVFFDEDFKREAKERIATALPVKDHRKWLLWAPTFRGNVSTATVPEYPDLEFMQATLGDEYILLIKQHPLIARRPKITESVQGFAFDVTDECSIEDLICHCDMCISDYSSLVFEYSLMERPIIFFAQDKADYEDWRGFYYPYEEMTPGPIVSNTDDLIASIKKLSDNFDPSEVIAFREKFMSACDGAATQRIIKIIRGDMRNQ